jgi:hypothetical protein
MNDKIAAVVLTCDKYRDLSPLFEKSCSFLREAGIQCYLAEETIANPSPSGSYKDVVTGENDYSSRLMKVLSKITTPYCLVLLDDYFVDDEKLKTKIEEYLAIIEKDNLDYLKLHRDSIVTHKDRRIRSKQSIMFGKPYRAYDLSFHPSLWKTSSLKASLVKGMNAWQCEPYFAKAANEKGFICALAKNQLSYKEFVFKGRFFRHLKKIAVRNGYKGDRSKASWLFEAKFKIRVALSDLIPFKIKQAMKRQLRKKGKEFYSD